MLVRTSFNSFENRRIYSKKKRSRKRARNDSGTGSKNTSAVAGYCPPLPPVPGGFADGIRCALVFSVNNSHRRIAHRRAGTEESPVNTKMTLNITLHVQRTRRFGIQLRGYILFTGRSVRLARRGRADVNRKHGPRARIPIIEI